MKRKDECLFCKKRKCYERVLSIDPHHPYDEVACNTHVLDLHKHSDSMIPGKARQFISATFPLSRVMYREEEE